ncbi:MAG: hypothetical protein M1814_004118 [Vezdaea aestivalis]|nr:MAG: hypothetical protein M1814_004118 [Vezdaea aestivalis]
MSICLALDLYGTIVDPGSICQFLDQVSGCERERAEKISANWRKYQLEYTWRLNSMDMYQSFYGVTKNALKHAFAEMDIKLASVQIETIMNTYKKHLSVFEDVDEALPILEERSDLRKVIFTNADSEMANTYLTNHPLTIQHSKAFERTVTSDAVKTFKPAKKFYEHLKRSVLSLKDFDNRTWGIYVVSANPFDIVGAKGAGLKAIWVNRSRAKWIDQCLPDFEPDCIVYKLSDVQKLMYEYCVFEGEVIPPEESEYTQQVVSSDDEDY